MATDGNCSLEFFPPKTAAGRLKLLEETVPALGALNPEYCSVTYGAGGSTRDSTVDTVMELAALGYDVAPHISFGTDDHERMACLIHRYQSKGISKLVALRGDLPPDIEREHSLVRAGELVSFIRDKTGSHFDIAVAAYPEIHPEAPGYDQDIHFLKEKLEAGANKAVTQYFYNVESYFYFVDRCMAAGITQPVHPGIMPITDFAKLQRFSKACGAEIPRWIERRMADFSDDPDSAFKFGIEVVSQLCATLLESGAPPIHFYTMNQSEPVCTIARNCGLISLGSADAPNKAIHPSAA
ncbi:MAG: methylenetetrahydrofolate reductase [Halieaceae bacterium]